MKITLWLCRLMNDVHLMLDPIVLTPKQAAASNPVAFQTLANQVLMELNRQHQQQAQLTLFQHSLKQEDFLKRVHGVINPQLLDLQAVQQLPIEEQLAFLATIDRIRKKW